MLSSESTFWVMTRNKLSKRDLTRKTFMKKTLQWLRACWFSTVRNSGQRRKVRKNSSRIWFATCLRLSSISQTFSPLLHLPMINQDSSYLWTRPYYFQQRRSISSKSCWRTLVLAMGRTLRLGEELTFHPSIKDQSHQVPKTSCNRSWVTEVVLNLNRCD